jgi:phosphoglycerate dehydrogenase-like enzyme
MGKIGYAVARRAAGFGMHILYSDPNHHDAAERELAAVRVPFDELLRSVDFVSLHCPLTAETRGLIDADALRMMKRTAVLVNSARGPIVDQDALVQALSGGWIAAAALDVTTPEPLPPEHPLYHLPNCLILPHIGSATRGTRRKMAELACNNILAGLAGRRLPHCVNPEVYGL